MSQVDDPVIFSSVNVYLISSTAGWDAPTPGAAADGARERRRRR